MTQYLNQTNRARTGGLLLLLLEESVGNEVGHLKQAVRVEAVEGGASDDPF